MKGFDEQKYDLVWGSGMDSRCGKSCANIRRAWLLKHTCSGFNHCPLIAGEFHSAFLPNITITPCYTQFSRCVR